MIIISHTLIHKSPRLARTKTTNSPPAKSKHEPKLASKNTREKKNISHTKLQEVLNYYSSTTQKKRKKKPQPRDLERMGK